MASNIVNLDAIKARLAAATPGPWEWSVRPKRHMLIHRFSERGHLTVLETEGDSEYAEYPCANEADRAFIEHAPSDIAALVAEVERLRAEVDAERAAVVAWLRHGRWVEKSVHMRHEYDTPVSSAIHDAADIIERGEHRREEEP